MQEMREVSLFRGFFIIVLDLRLTKVVKGSRETSLNFFTQVQKDINQFNL